MISKSQIPRRFIGVVLGSFALAGGAHGDFTNPVDTVESADPWVARSGGFYYYLRTTGGSVEIQKSATLENVGIGTTSTVFQAPHGPILQHVWAPEMHFLDGKWYIYSCGSIVAGQFEHRMFVLESNTADPMGGYTYKGLLLPAVHGIDPTVLTRPSDGARFVVYSGYDAQGQCLYIAPLSNPWTAGAPVRISVPTNGWETIGAPINEGPTALNRAGKSMLFFSASGSWTPDYCLGLLVNTDGDFMNPASWVKRPGPVFQRWDANEAYSVGHNSFTTSPSGAEDWIVYHATSDPTGTQWPKRSARIQKFGWNPDDTPRLGVPVPIGVPLAGPDGEVEIPDLKAFYKFDGNGKDDGGGYQNGWIQGGTSFVPGVAGSAISFNGVDGRVSIPRSISEDISISFWVKTTDTGGIGNWYLGKGLIDGDTPGPNDDFGVALTGGNVSFGIGNPNHTITGTQVINDGSWHHVVATRNGATGAIALHVDGLPDGSGTGASAWRSAPATLRIGALNSGGGFLAGAIDEVRLYDRVLDPSEIAWFHHYPGGPPPIAGGSIGDADGDHLPDVWEDVHGLDKFDMTGDSGAVGDPDRDELANLMEFATGLDPQQPAGPGRPELTLETDPGDGLDYLVFRYRRRIDAGDLVYRPRRSNDLTDWGAPDFVELTPAVPNSDGITETVTVRLLPEVQPGSPPRGFVRLEVEAP